MFSDVLYVIQYCERGPTWLSEEYDRIIFCTTGPPLENKGEKVEKGQGPYIYTTYLASMGADIQKLPSAYLTHCRMTQKFII